MSAPAANAFSPPVRTMQPIAVVGVEREQRRAELVHQRVVERVELLRPVQGDEAGAARAGAAHLGEDAFVGRHGVFPAKRQRSSPRAERRRSRACARSSGRRRSPASCSMRMRTGRKRRSGAIQISAVRSLRPAAAAAAASGGTRRRCRTACGGARRRRRRRPSCPSLRGSASGKLEHVADAQQLGLGREQVGQLDELARGVLHARAAARAAGRWRAPRRRLEHDASCGAARASPPACPRRSARERGRSARCCLRSSCGGR